MKAAELGVADVVEVNLGDGRVRRARVLSIDRERATGCTETFVRVRLEGGQPVKLKPVHIVRRLFRGRLQVIRRDTASLAAGADRD